MKSALRDKRISALLFAFFLLAAIGFTLLALWFLRDKQYVSMIISAVISAVGYYGSVFAFFRRLDAGAAVMIMENMEFYGDKCKTVADLAALIGWTDKATGKFVKKCVKRGYMHE